MQIGGSRCVTFEFNNDSFNYFRVWAHTPFVYAKSDVYDLFAENQKTYGISLSTHIKLDLSDHHWSFSFLVLGFGIGLVRQWGY